MMRRRLAAILSADVVGYARLIREGEDATLAALKRLRREVVDWRLDAHGGRIVKLMGDGMLVEFPSAVEAVSAGVAIQAEMAGRAGERIVFRVGIDLGDVVVDDDDIHGDGVNVAARLQAECAPGGVCISDTVHEQVRNRAEFGFQNLGARRLKNIDRPIRAWQYAPDAPSGTSGTAGAALPSDMPSVAVLPSDTPSVAVLPFGALGGGPETEFLADGMVEDIITTLSKVPGMLVTARNSTFVYKGRPVDIRQVGREQGVRNVLEGSVRQIGNAVRVAAQLIDAESGTHLWAETFDGTTEDVFGLIDRIALQILEALEIQLVYGEQARLFHKGEWTIRSYQTFQTGRAIFFRFTRRANAEARERFEAAARESPDWPLPYVMLGWTYADEARWSWTETPERSLASAFEACQKAAALDPDLPLAWAGLGYARMIARDHDEALALARKSVALGPSNGGALHAAATVANYSGAPEEGLDFAKHAMRVTPVAHSNVLTELGHACALTGEPERGVTPLRRALALSPYWVSSRCHLIVALDAMGDAQGAGAEAAELMGRSPRFRLARWAASQPYRDPALLRAHLDALRRAGVPE